MKHLVYFLLGLLACGSARAVDLYSGSITVANQGAGERARALPLALRQVLVKVSGDAGVAGDPAVATQLGQAGALLLQTNYRDEVLTASGGAKATVTTMLAEFNPAGVDAILRAAGRPIWTTARPSLLAWLVIESGATRQVASANQSAALGALIREAEQRGFDVVLPVWDYQDQGRAPIESLWLGEMRGLRAASARYGTQAAVLARLRRTADGWNSRYTLIDLKRTGPGEAWLAIHANASEALADAIDGSADRLAARYATSPEDLLKASYETHVAGVRSGADYGRIVNYLKGLHVVRAAEATGAEGDRLLLRLDLSVTPSRFASTIEGDGVLDVVHLPVIAGDFAGATAVAMEANSDTGFDAVISASDGESGAMVEPMPLVAESLPILELALRH
ncbi:MAG: DUF2066 domain-containing protein [Lysobacterales bacterium]